MKFFDDLNREIILKNPPKKIVSLVPSVTETIATIGKEDILTGVTRFCMYPAGIKKKATLIGGTKTVNVQSIHQLKPDLILAEKSENNKNQVLLLAQNYPVYVFDIKNIDDGINMIGKSGELLAAAKATMLQQQVRKTFDKLKPSMPLKKALYLIWKNPWMAAGRDTFIGSMMEKTGFVSILPSGYKQVNNEYFEKAEIILLSSEPFPFKEKDRLEIQKIYPDKNTILVDGEMFAWFGTRMLLAAEYFKKYFLF